MKNSPVEPQKRTWRTSWKERWNSLISRRWLIPALLVIGLALSFLIPQFGLLNEYIQLIIMYVGINIIMATSLNLINGHMGEFSIGHAGFMSVGAYVSALLTTRVFPDQWAGWLFPVAVLAGGLGAALVSLLVAFPSFRTRGDYLAIVTLAFTMIVKSVIENIEPIGGARGIPGIDKLTTLPWVFFWTVLAVWVIRNFVFSNYGRGVLSIREDETASELVGVNGRQVKLLAFVLSSFFAGVGGALFAHLLQFISPKVFDLLKSTDFLIMVYLGGIGSIAGSVLGATLYTVLLEVLSPLQVWRFVLMPLLLIFLMLYRPRGILGLRELRAFIPRQDRLANAVWRRKHPSTPQEEKTDASAG